MDAIRIREARPEEAPALTELVLESKRHWGYEESLMELWREDLSITPEVMRRCTVFVAERGGELSGVAAVAGGITEAELEHLWVRPSAMRRGVGRRLFEHALEIARASGAKSIVIVSDPHAQPFYERLGARRFDFVSSKPSGRELPRLRMAL